MVGQKIITGDWDGEPIWRRKTSGEELADMLDEQENKKKCECFDNHKNADVTESSCQCCEFNHAEV